MQKVAPKRDLDGLLSSHSRFSAVNKAAERFSTDTKVHNEGLFEGWVKDQKLLQS